MLVEVLLVIRRAYLIDPTAPYIRCVQSAIDPRRKCVYPYGSVTADPILVMSKHLPPVQNIGGANPESVAN